MPDRDKELTRLVAAEGREPFAFMRRGEIDRQAGPAPKSALRSWLERHTF